MYKTSVYALVDSNIEEFAHRKLQKSQKVILSASHWLCVNVLLNNITFCDFCCFRFRCASSSMLPLTSKLMFRTFIFAVLLLKYCFPTSDQLQRYCFSDISYSNQVAYNCYLQMAWLNKANDTRHAWRHRWPALLTILNKIPFISTKWPNK